MAKRKRARSERRRARAEHGISDGQSPSADARVESQSPPSQEKPSKSKARKQAKARSKSRRGLPVAAIGWSVGGLAVIGLLALLLTSQGAARPADAATEQLAQVNAGTDVTVYSGRQHVVYHSDPPLPSTAAPRVDGQPTLVWFSAVWCPVCERMAPFAHETASEYRDRLVFIEKSIDEDRDSANRYGVRGTPTFIMLDEAGREVTRFHGQGDAASFGFQIEQALAALGS